MSKDSFREQLEKSGGRLILTNEGHEPLQKVFSASARAAALAARRAKGKQGGTSGERLKELTSIHETGGWDDGTHYSVEEDKNSGYEKIHPDEKHVKISVYDEGKAEGGHSHYAIHNGKAHFLGHSGSGPWGIPPGPHNIKGEPIPFKEFHEKVTAEHAKWKKYWEDELKRNG